MLFYNILEVFTEKPKRIKKSSYFYFCMLTKVWVFQSPIDDSQMF